MSEPAVDLSDANPHSTAAPGPDGSFFGKICYAFSTAAIELAH